MERPSACVGECVGTYPRAQASSTEVRHGMRTDICSWILTENEGTISNKGGEV